MKEGHFWKKGGGWVLIQWGLMTATLVAAPLWPHDWQGAFARGTAVVLAVGGAFFGLAGTFRLGRSRTIFPEPLPEGQLVTDGIYSLVRHPLYTSVILLSLAWAMWWRSLPSLGSALATVAFLDAKARDEEKRLRKRFREYDDYARRVKRLVPFLY